MRTSLPEICQTAHLAGLKTRNEPQKLRLAAAEALRQPSRRWRSRLSDVPEVDPEGVSVLETA
ncbi:hypothetical protein, partial [Rhodovulum sp.]|uniref:hypothetical protein n=1 Tax=Rhodovulum sp. TaxID=34009 RepID=UPI00257F5F5D